jgi:hypothetical protein
MHLYALKMKAKYCIVESICYSFNFREFWHLIFLVDKLGSESVEAFSYFSNSYKIRPLVHLTNQILFKY